MAVRVGARDIEDGTLPAVCVVTGDPADSDWNVSYTNPVGALWLLLFFGVLPYVLARFLSRKVVAGRLPISARGIAMVRSRRRHGLVYGLGAFVSVIGGLVLAAQVHA